LLYETYYYYFLLKLYYYIVVHKVCFIVCLGTKHLLSELRALRNALLCRKVRARAMARTKTAWRQTRIVLDGHTQYNTFGVYQPLHIRRAA